MKWPPLRRRLFNAAAAAALLLCMATVGLWVRSYSFCDVLAWDQAASTTHGRHTLATYDGRVELATVSYDGPASGGESSGFSHTVQRPQDVGLRDTPSTWLGRLGFGYRHPPPRRVGGYVARHSRVEILVPLWFLTLLFSLPVSWRAWRWYGGRRRLALHLCPACGYDLRATPERCPECGATPPAAPSPSGG